uniref:Laminin G domain-containing protein n=1 Tax=Stomoxys calcitrans TaxID=35570 RepID=A0A1I8PRJ6_STOCA
MLPKQRLREGGGGLNQKRLPQNSLKNVLTCLLVTLLLLFEGHTIQATPITRLGQQQQQQEQQRHQLHNQHQQERPHHHQQQQQRQEQHQQSQEKNGHDCEHKSLAELIKSSPIILKALGSHIITSFEEDEELRFVQSNGDDGLFSSSWQSEQNEFVRGFKRTSPLSSSSSSSAGSSTFPDSFNARSMAQLTAKQKQNRLQRLQHERILDGDAILAYSSQNSDTLLITLTPDTIYKGASLLKTATNAAVPPFNMRGSSSSFGSGVNSDSGGDANNDGDSLYSSTESMVEGQLNATVQPLSCFDENLLKMLPTDLIIFGKLITMDQQPLRQHQQQKQQPMDPINGHRGYGGTAMPSSPSASTHQQPQPQQQKDLLKISINGLHRWSPQFESFIWTHLGWDDWSDFTVCSVACGKGVQQRFRRCLLDNPMVDMKMNFNEIEEEEIEAEQEELEVEQQVEEYDDDAEHNSDDLEAYVEEEKQYDDIDRMIFEDDDDDEIIEQLKAIDNFDDGPDVYHSDNGQAVDDPIDADFVSDRYEKTDVGQKKHRRRAQLLPAVASAEDEESIEMLAPADVFEMNNNMLHFVTAPPTPLAAVKSHSRSRKVSNVAKATTTTTTEQPEIMRIFEGDFNDVYSERIYNESPFNGPQLAEEKKDVKTHKKGQRTKHKRHKSAKIVSTMFCEGYNIEQRTCNNFECNDDINDLLKFYRKYPTTEETNAASTQTLNADSNTAQSSSVSSTGPSSAATASVANIGNVAPSTLVNDLGPWNSLTEAYNQNMNTITPIPINTGFVQTWHNLLNFTIMLTIRAKNDSSYNTASTSATATATIFSIRNGTHNLYLETYRDGLHLYLERDKTTEMLPIQFNLYDYRWHQVAISIKNGDFITIYTDCSWSNSFVVSKRLFSLPLNADVEVGKGFNGEFQQLLILPRLQGRRQCSEKRISINEVKRYIIDTFIGDYGN